MQTNEHCIKEILYSGSNLDDVVKTNKGFIEHDFYWIQAAKAFWFEEINQFVLDNYKPDDGETIDANWVDWSFTFTGIARWIYQRSLKL